MRGKDLRISKASSGKGQIILTQIFPNTLTPNLADKLVKIPPQKTIKPLSRLKVYRLDEREVL